MSSHSGSDAKLTIGIAVMCKPPRAGLSKTRLAAGIGPEAAASLSAAFLRDVTVTVTTVAAETGCVPYAVYAPADAADEIAALVPPGFRLLLQERAGLGQLMLATIATVLAECPGGCLLIGADMPALPARLLLDAITRLQDPKTDVVFIPTADGGYCLIGTKAMHATLFEDIPWSTPVVLDRTLARAADATLRVAILPPCLDVDDAGSLSALMDTLRNDTAIAPNTRAVLKQLGWL
jgi:uncharacterized protein